MPQRMYETEDTRSAKGYRLVPSLDPNISAVEVSLRRGGFAHYMPVEQRVVRDRKKTNVWHKRRFPLLLGYVFVEDVDDWLRLEEKTPGVASIVRSRGRPMPILDWEMEELRAMEADSEAEAEAKLQWMKQQAEAKGRTRRMTMSLFPVGTAVRIVKGAAQDKTGLVTGTDREGRLKLIVQRMEMSVSLDAVRVDLEAAE